MWFHISVLLPHSGVTLVKTLGWFASVFCSKNWTSYISEGCWKVNERRCVTAPSTAPGTRWLLISVSQLCLRGEILFPRNLHDLCSNRSYSQTQALRGEGSRKQKKCSSESCKAVYQLPRSCLWKMAFIAEYFPGKHTSITKQITRKYQHTPPPFKKKYLLLMLREVDWTVERTLKWKPSETCFHA